MQTLRELGAGGILGDDMGLGKTLQSLAHPRRKQAGRLDRPALVVMPTSLIPNWQDEASRFAPHLRVLTLTGSGRQKHFAGIADHDLLLTSYALLTRDIAVLREQPLHLLILDEAQHIKNPSSKAAQAVRELQTRQRLCLTGTPLKTTWASYGRCSTSSCPAGSAMRGASPRITATPSRSMATRPVWHICARACGRSCCAAPGTGGHRAAGQNEFVHWVELSPAQRERYETLRLAMDRKVRDEIERKGLARSQMVILEALLKLRQVCCDLRLLKGDAVATSRGSSSGKLDSLLDMLDELMSEGRRVLLFSQFTSMLALIEQALLKRGITYVKLTGETDDRRTPVERFQAGEVPLFLISLKAGGTGLNLTAADTVIHYDPWWNPAAENQATDRAYRIGQDKPVFVYRLITRGTVEERIRELQARKAELAAGVLEGSGEGGWQLAEQDIEALFAPLP